MPGGDWVLFSPQLDPVRLSCPLGHTGRLSEVSQGKWTGEQTSHMLCCPALVCDPKGSLLLLYKLKHALFSSTAGFMQTHIFTEIEGSTYLQNNHFKLCLKCSLFFPYNDIFCVVLLEAFLNKLLQLALQSLQPGRCWATTAVSLNITALSKGLLQSSGPWMSQHLSGFKPGSLLTPHVFGACPKSPQNRFSGPYLSWLSCELCAQALRWILGNF